MKIALLDNQATLDGTQRALLDLACGLLTRRWEPVAILGAEGPLHQAFRTLGIPVMHYPLDQRKSGLRTTLGLARICRRLGVRDIYANSPLAAFYGALAMRVIRGRTYWRIFRDTQIHADRFHAWMNTLLCTQMYPATSQLAEYLRKYHGARSKMRIIPATINLNRYPWHDQPVRKKDERPVVGMLAPWDPLSGHEVMIRALRLLHASNHTARLRFACMAQPSTDEERYLSIIHGAVKASGFADRIVIEGTIHDLPNFLAHCDIVVVPFLRETTGRLALEAAAIGRPVVASRITGITEIVEDGHTGLLVPPGDPRALSDALGLLLASPALRTEMGRQGHIRAEEHFSLQPLLEALGRYAGNEQFTGITHL